MWTWGLMMIRETNLIVITEFRQIFHIPGLPKTKKICDDCVLATTSLKIGKAELSDYHS